MSDKKYLDETGLRHLINIIKLNENDNISLVYLTWQELKNLKDNGKLLPGNYYRISDYNCTTTQEDTKSANHQFDIIVMALDEFTLSEEAKAIKHESDTYFTNCNLSAWKIQYCLENDSSRFAWADPNGKGIVYSMLDEWGNYAPYDFKNIQFKRYTCTVGETTGKYGFRVNFPGSASGLNTSDFSWMYTFDNEGLDSFIGIYNETDFIGSVGNNIISPCINPNNPKQQQLNNIIISSFIVPYSNVFENDCRNITLSNKVQLNSFGNSCYGIILLDSCTNNKVGDFCNNITFQSGCSLITLGAACDNISFGERCDNNVIEDKCSEISFGEECSNNIVKQNCLSLSFGSNCGENIIGISCTNNVFGEMFNDNVLASECNNNTFAGITFNNTFGQKCDGNTFGQRLQGNTFGNEITGITTGTYFRWNTIESKCSNITFGTSSNILNYWIYNTIRSGSTNIEFTLKSGLSNNTSNYIRNYTIDHLINSSKVTIEIPVTLSQYPITITKNKDNEIVQIVP